jgi:hypothetical protein
MTWLIYQAVGFRHKNKIQPINIYVNYLGENFLKDVNADKLGPDVKTYLMLMLRHWEGSITLHIYKNHKKTKTIINEDQLKFD